MEEIGAPEGSTFLVRNVFYNTPARKKFLKSAAAEAGYISDLLEHLALSHPEISFKFINSGQIKLHTSGNGSLKDIIYSIYGREIASNLLEVNLEREGVSLTGFIGKPLISRGNRNFENYFVNGRYVKSKIIAGAIEEGYRTFMMQHRYPFTVLSLVMDGSLLDINVHPTKMDLRFADNEKIYRLICEGIRGALTRRELIPNVSVGRETSQKEEKPRAKETEQRASLPEPFEKKRRDMLAEPSGGYLEGEKTIPVLKPSPIRQETKKEIAVSRPRPAVAKAAVQMELFPDQEKKLLSESSVPEHRLIGQVFDTYWIVQFRDSLYIIDQHAAHEKVMYERLRAGLKTREFTTQRVSPPIILSLSMQEEVLLKKYLHFFTEIGFEIEPFGGREYCISGVPGNFFGITDRDLFIEMLDSLSDASGQPSMELLQEKLATMACKSAVKGNSRMSAAEANALIRELLGLENPYNCPHGRPTIISMSRYELEKKFKRIV